jgi:hypothetical protein
MLSFGQVEDQDAVLIAGFRLLRIDRSWQRKALLVLTFCEAAPVSRGI